MQIDKVIKLANKAFKYINFQPVSSKTTFVPPKKALIILPEFIGDILLLTPALKNLNYNFKNSIKLDAIGNINAQNLLEPFDYFDNFYLDRKEHSYKLNFLNESNYDTIFLFNFRFFWALAGYQAKIKQRVGFSLEKMGIENLFLWPMLMTHLIKSTTIYEPTHQINIYLDMLKEFNLDVQNYYPEMKLTQNDTQKADTIIKDIPAPRAVIHASAGSPGKQWNLDNWSVVIRYLKEKYNFNLISTGSLIEKHIYDYLSQKSGIKIHNLCGKTTIRETMALYKHIDLCITLDTAAAHFAAAANTKNIIVIYGPTNESQWKPYNPNSFVQQIHLNLDCRPCLTRLCLHRKCLKNITPDFVINAVDNIRSS